MNSFLEILFKPLTLSPQTVGGKVRALRLRKRKTAVDLANSIGVSNSAIRNYESNYRQISPDVLQQIADNLGTTVEALQSHNFNNLLSIVHAFFELYNDNIFQFYRPSPLAPLCMFMRDETLTVVFEEWYNQIGRFEHGEITQEELYEWQDSFPFSFEKTAENNMENYISTHNNINRIFGYKTTMESQNFIVKNAVEEITDYLKHKKTELAIAKLHTLQKTIDDITENAKKEYR